MRMNRNTVAIKEKKKKKKKRDEESDSQSCREERKAPHTERDER